MTHASFTLKTEFDVSDFADHRLLIALGQSNALTALQQAAALLCAYAEIHGAELAKHWTPCFIAAEPDAAEFLLEMQRLNRDAQQAAQQLHKFVTRTLEVAPDQLAVAWSKPEGRV